ncbi:putative DNA-binding domain-containing protein [Microbulbifer bruguierae]|uniref:DNA-binding domain-containing protein n=1 Tax=Microbulbifer bruguierae TaxID=3029061 RepID=A0ABY8NCF4_9GAMM|nr:putative DNA-binding domain-containing protein [Microbulbifer bruguierae]WGL16375.1 putative DNA-binding domain-containing protein [Microbulbifer bruguierae]
MTVKVAPDNGDANVDRDSDREGAFLRVQNEFAAHLRNPEQVVAPADVEDRRLGIYRDLIYNNIESFIASGFPVLRSIYSDDRWHEMVRDFVARHASQSPYFLQISEEFLHYLQNERSTAEGSTQDPPFLLELAHYEWVELVLDVSDDEIPGEMVREYLDEQLLDWVPVMSPLAWNLTYQFPVHRLGPTYQPDDLPQTPTFLVVYRNRADTVGFLEANAVTSHLLQLIESAGDGPQSGRQLLLQLAADIQHPAPEQLLDFGVELLRKLLSLHILAGYRPR